MSVTVRPFRNGGWEVDIRVMLPNGTPYRDRRKAPVTSKSGAKRWGQERQRQLLLHGPARKRKEVPTLGEFGPRFLEGNARANRHKPSGIAAKESMLRVHLVPFMGDRKLDAIRNEDVQRLKGRLRDRAAKTVNNVLSTLNTLLRVAVEWDVIDQVPCTVRLLKVPEPQMKFHDFDQYSRLMDAACKVDPRAHLAVLLGGDAGLRCGEMMALEWTDIDFPRRDMHIQRSDWKGHVTSPKGDRPRHVPLTQRLVRALQNHRHLSSPRVLCQADGNPLTQKIVQCLIRRAARRANLANGGVHILRHTFCSHLAMHGAPARAIQEVAGHRNLTTTQRYMHMSPAAIQDAIRLLEGPSPVLQRLNSATGRGDIVETSVS